MALFSGRGLPRINLGCASSGSRTLLQPFSSEMVSVRHYSVYAVSYGGGNNNCQERVYNVIINIGIILSM